LVSAIDAGLFGPARLLGHLLKVGLDAGLNRRFALLPGCRTPWISIGERQIYLTSPSRG